MDHQISSSSYLNDAYRPYYGRLLNQSLWIPNSLDMEPWIQISFNHQVVVSGIVVDGHLSSVDGWIWIDKFYVTYSHDSVSWIPYVYFSSTSSDKVKMFLFV